MSVSQPLNQQQGFFFKQNNNTMKKKRKDFDFDFDSELPFPPQKSTRLECDSDLLLYGNGSTITIMEEEEEEEEEPNLTVRVNNVEERALVLYQPSSFNSPLLNLTSPTITTPPPPPPPPFTTIVINSHFIPGLKDYLLSRGTLKLVEHGKDEAGREKSSQVSKDCLAVIPWVASHSPMACEVMAPPVTAKPSELEAQEVAEMMDMDDEPHINDTCEMADVEAAGASTPWQQHFMMPNMLLKSTTSMRWC